MDIREVSRQTAVKITVTKIAGHYRTKAILRVRGGNKHLLSPLKPLAQGFEGRLPPVLGLVMATRRDCAA